MIKKFLSAWGCCWLLAANSQVKAQTSEFNISAGGGLSGLQYDIKNGKSSLKPGFQLGAGYTWFINSHWGIGTGLEFGYYHSKATLTPNTVFATNTIDSESDAFEFRVKTKGYEEQQKLYTVNIPLMMQFQTPGSGSTQLYAQGGAKLSIPLKAPYQTHADEIIATGYYPDVNLEVTDLPVHGFGTQSNWSDKGENDFKLSYSLSAEAGAKFRLSPRSYLYAGAYIDYGLNNIKKEEGKATLLTYNPTALNQSQANGIFSLANTTGDVRLASYGIKLRIGFSAGKSKKVSETKTVIEPAPPPPVKAEVKEEPAAPPVVEPIKQEETVRDTLTAEEQQLLKTPVHFNKIGNISLSPASQAHAEKLAELLQRRPNINLLIEGHTCNKGSKEANLRIGMDRANEVAQK
jgi:OmpA-OmpF porin, OOP family